MQLTFEYTLLIIHSWESLDVNSRTWIFLISFFLAFKTILDYIIHWWHTLAFGRNGIVYHSSDFNLSFTNNSEFYINQSIFE